MTRNNFSYDDITRKVKQKVLISWILFMDFH
jgi:hypothetical protein